jgi:1,4-dihydroxy-6-naphthoate synthase
MELTLGFSPCPNDTFIFDALVHQKIDTEGLTYKFHLADVEELNVNAFNQKADITKVSFSAFLQLTDNYFMLNSGAALGFGTGPLVISKSLTELSQLKGKKIAIPGIHTTANLLFSIAIQFPVVKKEFLFSEIEQAVLSDDADAGLIIHESRFTYQQKGLKKILDLGEYWENRTGLPNT